MNDPRFAAVFGRDPQVRADAPGRVNLIGEHTDYNGGYVLPLAIPRRTRALISPRADGTVAATSTGVGAPGRVERYLLGHERPGRGWLDYVQGITEMLRAAGHALRGFDLLIDSDVPVGAGLASSAALEVSLLRALRQTFDLRIDDVEMARVGQRAEVEFVGAPVGIMDQMAASLADETHALFLDTRAMSFERIPLPGDVELVVINSGISHRHAGGEYSVRRRECEDAAAKLGVRELRDVPFEALGRLRDLPAPLDRRARHVVSENDRVVAAVDAMRRGDVERLGALCSASHDSMRDDFEVSLPPIDRLVQLALDQPEVLGARLTGGGFGGSILILARAGTGLRVARRVSEAFRAGTGYAAEVILPDSSHRLQ